MTDCRWFDIYDDDSGKLVTERCTSGKPATFRNCGFAASVRVCEDHRCRCKQPSEPSAGDRPYPAAVERISSPDEYWQRKAEADEYWQRKAEVVIKERAKELGLVSAIETERDAAVAEVARLREELRIALATTKGFAIEDDEVRILVTALGGIVVHLRGSLPTELKRVVTSLAPALVWLYPSPGETRALRDYDTERSRRAAAEAECVRLRDAIRDTLQRWAETTGDGSMWGEDAHVLGPLRAALAGP